MSQPVALAQVHSRSLQRLQAENAELRKYCAAQRSVIASLERRAGRSLESIGVHVNRLPAALLDVAEWQQELGLVQHEIDTLCDLLADATLLQKLEAGKVEVKLEPLNLYPVLTSVSRHLLEPRPGSSIRLVCNFAAELPLAMADQDLTEAVLMDLLARSLKYSDPHLPVLLEAEPAANYIHIKVTGQRFAPPGDRDSATEIILCCRRIEVQGGEVTCQHHPDGLQTVTVALQVTPTN